ncbi:PAS domain-containing protein, partial [Streptomyces sp. NPDC057052]|uniref:PAS domain-containing protein n=1 Tax=Streptomyces sp. NPDC057052 TaxID=3346010 RepID=UPI00362A50DD
MTGSAGDRREPPAPPAALLAGAVADGLRTGGGRAGGLYLCSGTPGLLRLAVLSGLPGPLFRPWDRVSVDRPFPVADAYRLGVPVVLANATEAMRRYPQFAAGLPFQFGTLNVPVRAAGRTFGVMTVLRPAADDAAAVLAESDRLQRVAEYLGVALLRREAAGDVVTWDAEPLCVRPPALDRPPGRFGHLTWDPATDAVTADGPARALLGLPPDREPGTPAALTRFVDPADAQRLPALLRETAHGRPQQRPVQVRLADGGLRLLELWPSGTLAAASGPRPVAGVLFDPGQGALADGAADLLPQGVFRLDRLGLVVYANPRAAHLLGVPRDRLLGRSLWDAVPWLNQPACEEHLRGALLCPEPVHFHVRRPDPTDSGESRPYDAGSRDSRPRLDRPTAPRPYEGDWLSLAVYPGPDTLTCTAVPANRVPHAPAPAGAAVPAAAEPPADVEADTPAPDLAASTAPPYRPVALAIALTEA